MEQNLTQQLFDAIDLIIAERTQKVQKDEIIQCAITKIISKNDRAYGIEHNSTTYTAYAKQGEEYQVGDYVTVSIPKGDFNRIDKLILGQFAPSKDEGLEYEDPFQDFIVAEKLSMAEGSLESLSFTGDFIEEVDTFIGVSTEQFQTSLSGYDFMGIEFGINTNQIPSDNILMRWAVALELCGENGEILRSPNPITIDGKKIDISPYHMFSNEIYGNPNTLFPALKQRKLFYFTDKTNLSKLKKIKICLYAFNGQKSMEELGSTLTLNDLTVSFGYDVHKYLDSPIHIYTKGNYEANHSYNSKLEFAARDGSKLSQPAVHAFLVDQEKKRINTELTEGQTLRWYKHVIGETGDEYGGAYWKHLSEADNSLKLEKDKYEVDIDRPNTQIKAVLTTSTPHKQELNTDKMILIYPENYFSDEEDSISQDTLTNTYYCINRNWYYLLTAEEEIETGVQAGAQNYTALISKVFEFVDAPEYINTVCKIVDFSIAETPTIQIFKRVGGEINQWKKQDETPATLEEISVSSKPLVLTNEAGEKLNTQGVIYIQAEKTYWPIYNNNKTLVGEPIIKLKVLPSGGNTQDAWDSLNIKNIEWTVLNDAAISSIRWDESSGWKDPGDPLFAKTTSADITIDKYNQIEILPMKQLQQFEGSNCIKCSLNNGQYEAVIELDFGEVNTQGTNFSFYIEAIEAKNENGETCNTPQFLGNKANYTQTFQAHLFTADGNELKAQDYEINWTLEEVPQYQVIPETDYVMIKNAAGEYVSGNFEDYLEWREPKPYITVQPADQGNMATIKLHKPFSDTQKKFVPTAKEQPLGILYCSYNKDKKAWDFAYYSKTNDITFDEDIFDASFVDDKGNSYLIQGNYDYQKAQQTIFNLFQQDGTTQKNNATISSNMSTWDRPEEYIGAAWKKDIIDYKFWIPGKADKKKVYKYATPYSIYQVLQEDNPSSKDDKDYNTVLLKAECHVPALYTNNDKGTTETIALTYTYPITVAHPSVLAQERNVTGVFDLYWNMLGKPLFEYKTYGQQYVLEQEAYSISGSDGVVHELTWKTYTANKDNEVFDIVVDDDNDGKHYLQLNGNVKFQGSKQTTIMAMRGQLTILQRPLIAQIGRYDIDLTNEWAGKKIWMDQKQATIMASAVGAGHKESDNSFTGVLMGQISTDTGLINGLYGFSKGQRSFGIDALTGDAYFGGHVEAKSGNIGGWTIRPQAKSGTSYDTGIFATMTGPEEIPELDENGEPTGETIVRINQYQAGMKLPTTNTSDSGKATTAAFYVIKNRGNLDGEGKYAPQQYMFYVQHDGKLYAKDATIEGSIVATSLKLASTADRLSQDSIQGLADFVSKTNKQLSTYVGDNGEHLITLEKVDDRWNNVYSLDVDKRISGSIDALNGKYILVDNFQVKKTPITLTFENKTTTIGYKYTSTLKNNDQSTTSTTFELDDGINKQYLTDVGAAGTTENLFFVSGDGLMFANNAIIMGTIYAGAGKIAGWSISPNLMYQGSKDQGTKFGICSNPGKDEDSAADSWMYAGVYNSETKKWTWPFYVYHDGTLHATGANIKGTIHATTLTLGEDVTIGSGHLDSDVLITGTGKGSAGRPSGSGSTSSTGYFEVDAKGLLWAKNAVVDGTIYANGGEIAGWSIQTDQLRGSFGTKNAIGERQLNLCSGPTPKNADGTLPPGYITDCWIWVRERIALTGDSQWEYPFYVLHDGTLKATKAKIEGEITATGGKIANLNIGTFTDAKDTYPNSLHFLNVVSDTEGYRVFMRGSSVLGNIVFGVKKYTEGLGNNETPKGNYVFSISNQGHLSASSATIKGVLTTDIGSSIGGFKTDLNSIYSGGAWSGAHTPDVFMCTGSIGNSQGEGQTIAGRTQRNWCFGAGESFGVTKFGSIFCQSIFWCNANIDSMPDTCAITNDGIAFVYDDLYNDESGKWEGELLSWKSLYDWAHAAGKIEDGYIGYYK